jgi:hypothetical protein
VEWIKLSKYNLPPQGLKILCFKEGDLWVSRRFNYKGKSVYLELPFDPIHKANVTPEPEYWMQVELPQGFTGYIKLGIDGAEPITLDILEREDPETHKEFVESVLKGVDRFRRKSNAM